MRGNARTGAFFWYWPLAGLMAFALIGALQASHEVSLHWAPLMWLLTVVMGAVGGVAGARSGDWRAVLVRRREAELRTAALSVVITSAFGLTFMCPEHALQHLICVLGGVRFSYLAGQRGWFLTAPEQHYLRALTRWRAGDKAAAREAIGNYLKSARKDPRREERIDIARRFLEEDGASLAPATELEAAEAPAGRGTEPEAAMAPAGRGTEPEAVQQEPDGSPAGREGAALRERRRQ